MCPEVFVDKVTGISNSNITTVCTSLNNIHIIMTSLLTIQISCYVIGGQQRCLSSSSSRVASLHLEAIEALIVPDDSYPHYC